MYSVAVVLVVVGLVALWFKFRKLRIGIANMVYYTFILLIVVILVVGFWVGMFDTVKKVEEGYYQQEIVKLTQELKEQEKWKEMLEEELADNPVLLNHMEPYIEKEIEYYNEEIKRYIGYQEQGKRNRKLLYFK